MAPHIRVTTLPTSQSLAIVFMSCSFAARSFRGALAQRGCSSSGATDRERAVGRRLAGGLYVVFLSNFNISQGSDIATALLASRRICRRTSLTLTSWGMTKWCDDLPLFVNIRRKGKGRPISHYLSCSPSGKSIRPDHHQWSGLRLKSGSGPCLPNSALQVAKVALQPLTPSLDFAPTGSGNSAVRSPMTTSAP